MYKLMCNAPRVLDVETLLVLVSVNSAESASE